MADRFTNPEGAEEATAAAAEESALWTAEHPDAADDETVTEAVKTAEAAQNDNGNGAALFGFLYHRLQ